MLPDRVSSPGPLTYESGALPIALRGLAFMNCFSDIRKYCSNLDLSTFDHQDRNSYCLNFDELCCVQQKLLLWAFIKLLLREWGYEKE